jgi:hypothetical protein
VIANAVDLSTYAVRQALGLVGPDKEPAVVRVEKRWVSPKGRCPKTSPAVEQSHDPNTAHDDRALVEPATTVWWP